MVLLQLLVSLKMICFINAEEYRSFYRASKKNFFSAAFLNNPFWERQSQKKYAEKKTNNSEVNPRRQRDKQDAHRIFMAKKCSKAGQSEQNCHGAAVVFGNVARDVRQANIYPTPNRFRA